MFGPLITSILSLIIPLLIKPPFPAHFIDDAVEHRQIYESKNAAGNWASVDIQLDESGYSGGVLDGDLNQRQDKQGEHVCVYDHTHTSRSAHGDDAILSDEQTIDR